MKTKYKMRAECQNDLGHALLAIPMEHLTASQVVSDGTTYPDVIVEFVSSMPLEEIRNALSNIVDGHVMAETVELESEYTGNRKYTEEEKK